MTKNKKINKNTSISWIFYDRYQLSIDQIRKSGEILNKYRFVVQMYSNKIHFKILETTVVLRCQRLFQINTSPTTMFLNSFGKWNLRFNVHFYHTIFTISLFKIHNTIAIQLFKIVFICFYNNVKFKIIFLNLNFTV